MEADHAYAFASDNTSGIAPPAWAALQEANASTVGSYGDDPYTEEACQRLREFFEHDALQVFFVFNGTAANALALSAICQGYHAIIAHEKAHIMTDECGAPEHFTGGAKILPCPGEHAKLTPAVVENAVAKRRDLHFPKPRALSLTQATEFGTTYEKGEMEALSQCAQSLGLRVHLDGARFTHALVHHDLSPADLSWRVGVDVMSLGLTKLGAGVGEAVLFFDADLAQEFDYRCKQAGQLASKMRILTATWCGLLRDDAWRALATEANAKATQLRQRLGEIPGIELLFPTEANAVFARFPAIVHEGLQAKGWHYYELAGVGDARLMCSWATTQDHIDAFISDVNALIDR